MAHEVFWMGKRILWTRQILKHKRKNWRSYGFRYKFCLRMFTKYNICKTDQGCSWIELLKCNKTLGRAMLALIADEIDKFRLIWLQENATIDRSCNQLPKFNLANTAR